MIIVILNLLNSVFTAALYLLLTYLCKFRFKPLASSVNYVSVKIGNQAAFHLSLIVFYKQEYSLYYREMKIGIPYEMNICGNGCAKNGFSKLIKCYKYLLKIEKIRSIAQIYQE